MVEARPSLGECLKFFPDRIPFQALLKEPTMEKYSRSYAIIATDFSNSKTFWKGTFKSFPYDPSSSLRSP